MNKNIVTVFIFNGIQCSDVSAHAQYNITHVNNQLSSPEPSGHPDPLGTIPLLPWLPIFYANDIYPKEFKVNVIKYYYDTHILKKIFLR